jgi:hypothetical protein
MEFEAPGNSEEDCSTDVTYMAVFGGTYEVELVFASLEAGVTVDEAALNVIFIPFNGSGEQP